MNEQQKARIVELAAKTEQALAELHVAPSASAGAMQHVMRVNRAREWAGLHAAEAMHIAQEAAR